MSKQFVIGLMMSFFAVLIVDSTDNIDRNNLPSQNIHIVIKK